MMSFLYSLDSSFVEGLRTFDITCSLSGNLLRCMSDSTVMPGRTTCQIDNGIPFNCEFHLTIYHKLSILICIIIHQVTVSLN